MSTPRCPTCKRNFWKYRPDQGRYCSVECRTNRTKRKLKVIPETAASVLDAFKEHRLTAHATKDLNAWFDCDVCDRYEERYAVSMYL